MKRLLLTISILASLSVPAIAFNAGPPEDTLKLAVESEKRFHVTQRGEWIQLHDGLSKPYSGTPEEAALQFLKDYRRMAKLSQDLSEIRYQATAGMSGLKDVLYQQYYKNVPVKPNLLSVTLNSDSKVIAATLGIVDLGDNFNTEPVIKPGELAEVLKSTAPEYDVMQPSEPRLCIYCYEDRNLLVYETIATKKGARQRYELQIDAATGRVVKAIRGGIGDK